MERSRKDYGTIIAIGDILVSEDVVNEYFACDYSVCKGECCIVGDSGAPLREEETEELERAYDSYKGLMTEKGRAAVSSKGFFEIDREGDIVTPVVPGEPGREECAFCHFAEDGSCLCAVEMTHPERRGTFVKPVSCRLYPIRVVKLGEGTIGLNLHRWKICEAAYERGRREGIRVHEFLRGPLEDVFGREFYSALCAAAEYSRR